MHHFWSTVQVLHLVLNKNSYTIRCIVSYIVIVTLLDSQIHINIVITVPYLGLAFHIFA